MLILEQEKKMNAINRPIVKTRKGTLCGIVQWNNTLAFLGIPFAQPPVGRLRWREPLDLPDSNVEIDCSRFGPIPVQTENDDRYRGLEKGEDCLTLNVFTADLEHTGRPVLVWAYGGAYIKGGTSYPGFNGDLMVSENPDIVLVTVNYRIGVLGSLNLSRLDPSGEYKYSNNLSRLDLRSALKWVHENIEAFGGDPDNVTVWGHSAGSNNISAQLLMDGPKYFNKAIMHSSFAVDVGLTSWETSLGAADVFFDILKVSTLEELLAVSPLDIFSAQEKLLRSDFFDSEKKALSAVPDDIVISKDGFERLAGGSCRDIDIIAGTTWGEYDQQFRAFGTTEEQYVFLRSQCGRKVGDLDALISFYQAQDPKRSISELYMDIKNDLWLRVPGNILAQAAAQGGSRVWMYNTQLRTGKGVRSKHGSEFAMMFCRREEDLVTEKTARSVRQSLLNFVRSGAPQNGGLPEWPQYDGKDRATMVFCEEPEVRPGIRLAEMDRLWPLYQEVKFLEKETGVIQKTGY